MVPHLTWYSNFEYSKAQRGMNFQAEQLSCQEPWISPALLPFLEGTRDGWTHADVQRWKVRNFQWEAECICLSYFMHFWRWALKLHSCQSWIVMPREIWIAGNSHVRKAHGQVVVSWVSVLTSLKRAWHRNEEVLDLKLDKFVLLQEDLLPCWSS